VVDRTPSCAAFGSVVETTIRANNCVPGCPGPCHTVPWPRPATPFDQGKWDDTGLHRTGRDSPGLSDNAEVGSSILPSPTQVFLVRALRSRHFFRQFWFHRASIARDQRQPSWWRICLGDAHGRRWRNRSIRPIGVSRRQRPRRVGARRDLLKCAGRFRPQASFGSSRRNELVGFVRFPLWSGSLSRTSSCQGWCQ